MSNLVCSYCKNEISDDSDYCTRCGTLLAEDVSCTLHNDVDAEGVCLICSEPYCSECGGYTNKVFLCREHNSYEIYEGFARIFGSSDHLQCEYVKNCLEQNSFHAVILSSKTNHIYFGDTSHSIFNVWGDTNNHIFNEIKVLVPCSEVLEAEKIKKELEL